MEDNEDDVFFASGTDLVDVDASIPGTALAFMAWALEELVLTLYNFFFFGAENRLIQSYKTFYGRNLQNFKIS
jgi:hypothetical protein